jgi:hypothetical protein
MGNLIHQATTTEPIDMTDYLHHVPGRLRVRSKALRCNSAARGATLRKLRTLEGVRTVRLNPKAGSVTVFYDVDVTGAQRILDFLGAECLRAEPIRAATRKPVRKATGHGPSLYSTIGRMALGALVNKGVNYSISSLLGARA